jgi:hypothetical protein
LAKLALLALLCTLWAALGARRQARHAMR